MDRNEMHIEMLELMEKCPLGDRVTHCPFRIFGQMDVKARDEWLKTITEIRLKEYLFDHRFCYLSRTNRLEEL